MRARPVVFKQWNAWDRRYFKTSVPRSAHIADLALEASDAFRGTFTYTKLNGSGRVSISFFVGVDCLANEVCDVAGLPLAVDRLVERVHGMIQREAA